MHCNEAERRLSRLEAVGGSPRDDAELQAHLESCPSCARQANASELLGRAFADLSSEGKDDLPVWARVRSDIERGANLTHRKPGRIAIVMEKIFDPLKGRTRRRVGFAAALAVLAFITLIPFHYQKTVGYEVAFAGVNKDLAMDQGKIEVLLSKLGLGTAKVDLANCEATTCSLVVSNLKSRDDCKALVYAMREIGDCRVVTEGDPQCEPAKGSLVELAKHNVFFVSEGSDDSEEIEARVVQCLGEDFPECINVWVDSDDSSMLVEFQGVAGCVPDSKSCTSLSACTLMVAMGDSCCRLGAGTTSCMKICDPESMKCASGSGTRVVELTPDAAKDAAVTPEGYVLNQNYPNPFNPSTSISFVLARSERVKVEVINMLGQRVRTLVDETMSAGPHEVQWDATSDQGRRVPSGTYLYHITAGDFNASRTMTLLK